MCENVRDIADPIEEVCVALSRRLRSRSSEIVETIYGCIREAVPDPAAADLGDDYHAGVRRATTALVEYGLTGIERGLNWSSPLPEAAVIQVRWAARADVSLSIVQRRYCVGHRCLGEFVAQEAEAIDDAASRWSALRHLHKTQQELLEHLMAALEHEYHDERQSTHSPEQLRIELVRRLLIEDVDPHELKDLDYELESCWHLGVIAHGAEGAEALRCAWSSRGRKLLCVPGYDGAVWAWLGGHAKLTVAELKALLAASGRSNASLAIGEPGRGLEGWRATHEEARMASLIARHEPCGLTRCADALPVVGALQNDALIEMYRRTYISPLNRLYKGGQPVRKSLLAYFKHGRNASCAGKAIKVTARTIQNHLNDTKSVLDAPLNLTGLEIALRLEELGYMTEAGNGRDGKMGISVGR
jgi:diguanylate cyclase with GGDEF domain